MKRAPRIALFACLLLLAGPAAQAKSPAQPTLTGVIKSFECGDNCYLVITTDEGKEVTGLCVATACAPWNEQVEIPRALIGAKIAVTLGTGRQLDGEGNDMGPFTSFTTVKLLRH